MEGYDIEDEVADYKFLQTAGGIPKRGEKEFEPDGTTIQRDALKESRDAMYDALQGTRGHHLKQKLTGVWLPSKGYAVIPHARGNYFRDVGQPFRVENKINSGLMLNSLEAVFLVERGSLIMYLANDLYLEYLYSSPEITSFDYETLDILDLGYLYSLAFDGQYSLDQHQVYSYLKRLGYLIQPFAQIKKQYPTNTHKSLFTLFLSLSSYFNALIPFRLVRTIQDWVQKIGIISFPITSHLHYATKHYFNYTSIFQSLRLIPSTKAFDSLQENPKLDPSYKMSFNVWKPTPSFSKKNPPLPDFQICIVNTDKTGPPNLQSIQALFNHVNYQSQPKIVPKFKKKSTLPPTKRELRTKRQQERQAKLDQSIQERNKYLKLRDSKLKSGNRSFIIALVSNGILNFVNLSEGDFSLTKCPELDATYNRDHGIIYMERL